MSISGMEFKKDWDILASIKQARNVGTPLAAINTADQIATVNQIASGLDPNAPIVCWNCVQGLFPCNFNTAAEQMLRVIVSTPSIPGVVPAANPTEALVLAAKFYPRSILFFANAQRFLDNTSVMQAVFNLRDIYKSDNRMLVLLGPAITLPLELVQDVMVLDEPLPDQKQIASIVLATYGDASKQIEDMEPMSDKILEDAVAALTGLAAFPAEQSCAMSIKVKEKRLDINQMWSRKRSTVNQTSGIEMLEDSELPTFNDIGGLQAAKNFGRALFSGKTPPRVVVWLDEIEKMFGGLGQGGIGDNTGVSQDQLGVMLREQEFNNWAGLIAVGPPGAGKSYFARALGKTHGVPTILLDLGAMKGSLVGQSEQQTRAALKVIKAIAGYGGAFFVATCNDLTVLPPELRRRYRYGIWFFDLPDKEERNSIWNVCLQKFGLSKNAERTFNDTGWTGAEIRNVCELAYRLNQPLDEASYNIVPVAISDANRLERLREAASNKFLSASYKGVYAGKSVAASPYSSNPVSRIFNK